MNRREFLLMTTAAVSATVAGVMIGSGTRLPPPECDEQKLDRIVFLRANTNMWHIRYRWPEGDGARITEYIWPRKPSVNDISVLDNYVREMMCWS